MQRWWPSVSRSINRSVRFWHRNRISFETSDHRLNPHSFILHDARNLSSAWSVLSGWRAELSVNQSQSSCNAEGIYPALWSTSWITVNHDGGFPVRLCRRKLVVVVVWGTRWVTRIRWFEVSADEVTRTLWTSKSSGPTRSESDPGIATV